MKVHYTRIPAPSQTESIILRIMVVIGVGSLIYFMSQVFLPGHKGYPPLYIPLVVTLAYMCLKYLHEWYHYFNISAPPVSHETGQPTVDIFTTYCSGEPLSMLETTLKAISQLNYPCTGWCGDESNDPAVKALCEQYGIRHTTRSIPVHAKAGNINNMLQQATGSICVVLDPDHVPAPEFLDVVLPYFEDPKVGFVQVVQAYYNHNESLIAKGAAQQTYQFYGPMMMCMYAYGTVQAIGANCTFRRAALDSIDGHAPGLAEDMHTAMKLHARGWTSVYVPAVIARGLVPSTMSAYFKQQLKWSRGTFELLFTTYPRLFTKFTLFQKIHYFLLPFHYLGGLIVLLNFLIPVGSLFTGQSPLAMDFTDFLLAFLPVACMAILIRQYVQKWVVEETERGFHMVGGLLQIGTWWIHLTGFIYTLIRKRVPYIPTPKEDHEPTPLILHLPNVVIIFLSAFAIMFGLELDWSPFSFFMSGIAAINIGILLFVIYASDRKNQAYSKEKPLLKYKLHFWYLRHFLYKIARKYALFLTTLVLLAAFLLHQQRERLLVSQTPVHQARLFYQGVYQPASEDRAITPSSLVASSGVPIQILSSYIALTDSLKPDWFPVQELQATYAKQALPLLTVEPWLGKGPVYKSIANGTYDSLLTALADQLAALRQPVFFRFAHEAENPRYPWSLSAENTPEDFIKAWRYVHDLFIKEGARKVIWVWNPWRPSAASFFPGRAYVDWIGVNVLDYSMEGSQSFEALYRPFHQDSVFHLGLPVLLTETGTLSADKNKWWRNTWQVLDTAFPEVQGVIAFNTRYDRYNIQGPQETALGWNWNTDLIFHQKTEALLLPGNLFENGLLHPMPPAPARSLPSGMNAVVYDKGYHWFRNLHTATIHILESDMKEMKELGLNTVFRTVGEVYDRNFFKASEAAGLHVVPRLWADFDLNTIFDSAYRTRELIRLLKLVRKYKKRPSIQAWNISNDYLAYIEKATTKPALFAYRGLYLRWLQLLIEKIKEEDPVHPVALSVQWNDQIPEAMRMYSAYAGQADAFLIDAAAGDHPDFSLKLPAKWAWGAIDPGLWNASVPSPIIPAWQDQQTSAFTSFDGLLDFKGRKKLAYFQVAHQWQQQSLPQLEPVRILQPARVGAASADLDFHALLKDDQGQWNFAANLKKPVHFEWYLVYLDPYHHPLSVKQVGNFRNLELEIPADPNRYRLYLEAITEKGVSSASCPLNLPF